MVDVRGFGEGVPGTVEPVPANVVDENQDKVGPVGGGEGATKRAAAANEIKMRTRPLLLPARSTD